MLTQAYPGPVTLSPNNILQTGLGFWSSKILLTAISIDLFTVLAEGRKTSEEICNSLDLHPSGIHEFLNSLVALKFITRHGNEYDNTAEADEYLDRNKGSYIGDLLLSADSRLQPFWHNLEGALRFGEPPSSRSSVKAIEQVFTDPQKLEDFLLQANGIHQHSYGVVI